MGRRRLLLTVLAAPAILLLLAALFLAWLAATGSGLRFAARLAESAVPGLQIEAPAGTLVGPLHIGRIVHTTPERQVVAEAVELHWQPGRLLDGLLLVDRLGIERLQVAARAESGKKPQPPADLTLPLAVRIEAFHVGAAAFGPPPPGGGEAEPQFTGVAGRLASDGRRHRLEDLHLATARLAVKAGASLDGRAPFPLAATAAITGEERGHPFTLTVDAAGPLRDLEAKAQSASGSLRVSGRARLDLFAPQPVRQASLTAAGLDPAAWVEGAPHARLGLDGEFAPVGGAEVLAGRVTVVNSQPGRLDEELIPLRRLTARLRQEGEQLRIPEFAATLVQGEITGSALWADGQLQMDARLAEVDAAAWHKALRPTRLGGELAARAAAASQQVAARLRDPRFGLELDATRRDGTIRLDAARLAAPGGSLEAAGQLDPKGAYDLKGRLRDFDPGAFADLPRGRLNASLDAKGRLGEKPSLDLHFALADSHLGGRPVAGRGDVILTPDRLEQADLSLRAGDNRIEARGTLGRPRDALRLDIAAPRLEQVGLAGAVHGQTTLFGPLRTPGAEWRLEAPSLLLPDGTQLRKLASHGRLEPGAARIDAALAVARLDRKGGPPALSDISARIEGQRNLHRLHAAARVGAEHAVEMAAAGGLGPDRVWKGRLETLEWRGPNPLRLAAPAGLEAGPGRLVLAKAAIAGQDWHATLDGLSWQPGRLRTAGRFENLPLAPFLPAASSATLRLGGEWDVDFGRTAAGKVRIFRQDGDLSLAAADQSLDLGLERLALTADFSGQQAALALDAYGRRAGTVDGRLTLGLRSDGGAWNIARHAPWRGRLELDTPSLAWLSPLAGEDVLLGGRLQGAVGIDGTPAAPAVAGQLAGSDLRVRLLDYGLDLGGGTLNLEFTPEVARLERLEMTSIATQRPAERRIDFSELTARPGRLVAEGEIAIKSGAGRIGLRAEQLVVSQLPDRWVMVSGNGGLRFTEGHLDANGALTVDAAYVELPAGGRPTLSEDVVVAGRSPEPDRVQRISLDVTVDLGRRFYFEGAGIETRLAGVVRLTAAQHDQLRARGTVRTVGGNFDAYGRELDIERGILNFQGLPDNPGLNVRALRKNLAVEAGVEVTGTVKNPRVQLVSVPDVPDAEKLSWMVLGRPPGEGVGAQDADLLLSAAMAMRGGGQGKGPLESLVQGLGLEEFSIASGTLGERSRFPASHVAGSFAQPGAATTTEQIATIGKRIGSNMVLSYERSITSAESIVKLTVELSRRLSLVGRVGATNAVGFLYSFAFGGGAKKPPPRNPP